MADATERIIGGTFGLAELRPGGAGAASWLARPHVLTVNARSAMRLVIDALRPRHTWVPSYLCDAMLQAIPPASGAARFYAVNDRLAVSRGDISTDVSTPAEPAWLSEVGVGDVVVLIDYFGFPCDAAVISAAHRRGAWVMEDASQAMFSEAVGRESDLVVFSPRKFLGIPDGGILVCNRPLNAGNDPLDRPPAEWWLGSLESLVLRRDFDMGGGDRRWFDLFQRAEADAPVGRIGMSDLAAAILRHSIPSRDIVDRRRGNFSVLLDRLGDLALFADLPAGVVPLGFPVRHPERDRLLRALFDRQIFPPIHWDVRRFVPAKFRDSHRLASETMTLPCDQRYDEADMRRMADCLRAAM